MTDFYGWTNWATWTIHLHIANDKDATARWYERAKEIWTRLNADLDPQAASRQARNELWAALQHWVHLHKPTTTDLYNDLLTRTINEIDYNDLADYYLDGNPGYAPLPVECNLPAARRGP